MTTTRRPSPGTSAASSPQVERDRRSLPLQVRDQIRALIEGTGLRPGDQLPTETELAARFGVARTTAREALKLLEQDGLVDVRHGLGRYVSQFAALERPITRLESVTEMMQARGYTVTNRVVSVAVRPASDNEAAALDAPPGSDVISLERVRLHRGDPIIYSLDVIPRPAIAGDLHEIDWSGSLLDLLEHNERNAVAARAQIHAARLPDAGRLAVGAGTAESDGPWILLVQLNLDEAGHPVIFSHDYYRGDRFTFNVFRRRFE